MLVACCAVRPAALTELASLHRHFKCSGLIRDVIAAGIEGFGFYTGAQKESDELTETEGWSLEFFLIITRRLSENSVLLLAAVTRVSEAT